MTKDEVNELKHNINNPLTAIRCCITIPLDEKPSVEERMKVIDKQVDRIVNYLKSLRVE